MRPQEKLKYTLDDYIELEKSSDEKFEYWDGNVFALAGVSDEHAQIQINLATALTIEFRSKKKTCRVFPSDMRVKVPEYPPYRYPDLSALCGKVEFEKLKGLDVLTNPQLIVEILSDSTEAFDRGDKFTYYKSIESFREYLLIAQHLPHVTQYVGQVDDPWSYREINGLNEKLQIALLDCEINLTEIYSTVTFPDNTFPFQYRESAE
ncbi:MAG: Uma2 family endonuclease [Pyrinomonadaceae bacterium]